MQDLDVVCRRGHRLDASRDGLVVALDVSGRMASERCSAAVMAADEHHQRGHTADCMCAASVTRRAGAAGGTRETDTIVNPGWRASAGRLTSGKNDIAELFCIIPRTLLSPGAVSQ